MIIQEYYWTRSGITMDYSRVNRITDVILEGREERGRAGYFTVLLSQD